MKPLSLLLLGVVVGWFASGVDWSREAVGQDLDLITDKPPSAYGGAAPRRVTETRLITDANGVQQAVPITRLVNADGTVVPETPPGLVGRFQATAYGSPSGHGCYIVDTMTGQTWHVRNGQSPQVVASGLTPYAPQPAMPTPAMNHPEPMMTPTPSYTESTPGLGTVNPPTPQSNVVPTPKSAEPTPDAAN
jgi:hypothetical protein